MSYELPTFREIAALRIADAGPRDKTINVKVAINTARMMVEHEQQVNDALVAALDYVIADLQNMVKDEVCDHEANICWCGYRRDIKAAREALYAAKKETSNA